jgi:hypothetical protein
MKYNYSYKYFPGRGYAGFVNNKRFTVFYDERDLGELKERLQREEEARERESAAVPKKLSFRDHLIKHGDPDFVKDYLEYISRKKQ